MADYILARKSRNIASTMVHILLNLLLGVGAVFFTVLSGNPAIGIILVILSKWRIFAVRWRYLAVSLKSNLVDLIIGISIVLLTYFSGTNILPVDFILAGFYCLWLLVIKPLTSERANLIQSILAVFFGMSAVTIATANLDSIVLVPLAFLIGYAASRHILVQAKDKEHTFSTLICGLVFAEISWISHAWSIIYTFGATGIRIPQLALILTIFAFIYNYARQAIVKYGADFRFKHILAPVLFGVIMIGIIVIGFSDPIFNI